MKMHIWLRHTSNNGKNTQLDALVLSLAKCSSGCVVVFLLFSKLSSFTQVDHPVWGITLWCTAVGLMNIIILNNFLMISNISILLCWNLVLPPTRQPERCHFRRRADREGLHTHLRLSICNRERLQLPPSTAVSSMRRSQSAVEATADYLGIRVVRLTYLNPDEANRSLFTKTHRGER